MPRIDLHTHSVASPDGNLTARDYQAMLASGRLNYIAITDHNRIDFALRLQAELGNLGTHIIVGEEITTQDGEIIGLYLRQAVPAGLSAAETARRIHQQGGLVYVPHPFETVRKGISLASLDAIADLVDIIETYNGRNLQNRAATAQTWAAAHHKPGAASSDAHGKRGWGKTATVLPKKPSHENLVKTLQTASLDTHSTGLIGRLYPMLNRLRRHQ
ncbi:MAG TPA: PHP domain-containing protein [Candidatus Saccharimonadales bacterium]|nr:PHP domain-containing protein [Candidatus Saccharimonadales bacterium]